MSIPNAVRILLEGLVDYAGLFPPAQLDMAGALQQFAEHRDSDAAWMLGRFIVPAARLGELEAAAAPLFPRAPASDPWRLSVLSADPSADTARITAFNDAHADHRAGLAVIDTIELKAATAADIERVAAGVRRGLVTYVEIPVSADPAELLGVLARVGARAKVRTGGVTPEAFPSVTDLARFIRASVDAGVPFKATAGLHHPFRGAYRLTYAEGSATAPMYGFLNVFLAAGLASRGLSLAELEQVLQTGDRAAFTLDDLGAGWGAYRLDLDDLLHARTRIATTFGSCSFAEPVDDLHTLEIL
ncbi:MAG: hypothetical protein H0U85_08425 [Gemmatimonadales bacterium]|nr:hypothetical protein [Gemmatimonadales bacterium]